MLIVQAYFKSYTVDYITYNDGELATKLKVCEIICHACSLFHAICKNHSEKYLLENSYSFKIQFKGDHFFHAF